MAPVTKGEEISVEKHDESATRLRKLLTEGKLAYISNNFKEAEAKLSEAAELSVTLYGYFAIPTFDPHYYYGKTLLELGRMEEGIIFNTLQETADTRYKEQDSGDDSSSDEEVQVANGEQVDEASEEKICSCRVDDSEEYGKEAESVEKKEPSESVGAGKCGPEKEHTKEKGTTIMVEEGKGVEHNKSLCSNEDSGEERNKDGIMAVKESDEKEDEILTEKDEDEISEEMENKEEFSDVADIEYLQRAWENLEVARTVCDRHLNEEGWKEKKVEVLLDLADCSTHSENYVQALDDIETCIKLMESFFEENDRRIAQGYFMKAQINALAKDFESAAKLYDKSKAILEKRITKLEEECASQSMQEGSEKIVMEIREMKLLMTEIQGKIDDALESANVMAKEPLSIKESRNQKVVLGLSVKDTPVDDVSSLVRKKVKREIEGDPGEKTKRLKIDE